MYMDCVRFEDSMSDYLDRRLAGADTREFAAHALRCRVCRAKLDEIKSALDDSDEETGEIPLDLEAALVSIPWERAELTCDMFQDLVTEFLDGFVPPLAYQRFEEHATRCESCSDLLTGVVLAVAACHSVHTYEDFPAPSGLVDTLNEIVPKPLETPGGSRVARLARGVLALLPSAGPLAPSGYLTASLIAAATLGLFLTGFSDDRSVNGVFRQAQVRAARFYSSSSELYARKDNVVAELQRVRSDIGEILDTIGGADSAPPPQPVKRAPSTDVKIQDSPSTPGNPAAKH
jgi:hypothetical protein